MGLAVPAWADPAGQPFFQGKEEGWFWYKDPKERLAQEPPKLMPPVPAPVKPKASEPLAVFTIRFESSTTSRAPCGAAGAMPILPPYCAST